MLGTHPPPLDDPMREEVLPGLFLGSGVLAVERIEAGEAAAEDFEFYGGFWSWKPGSWAQVEAGAWQLASASTPAVRRLMGDGTETAGWPSPAFKYEWLALLLGPEHAALADAARAQASSSPSSSPSLSSSLASPSRGEGDTEVEVPSPLDERGC